MGRRGVVGIAAALVVAWVLAAVDPALAAPAQPASSMLAGCAYTEMCVADGDRIVYHAFGSSDGWPSVAADRGDRVVNNGSAYDLIVYEHASSAGAPDRGWALCVPRGQVVGLGGLKPVAHDQASSHRWVAAETCGGRVSWVRPPGATGSSSPTSGSHVARAVEVARGQVGVREVPDNRGARVTTYQRSVRNNKIALGEPWCASFLTWVLLQAGDPTPLRSAVVSEWVRAAANGRAGMSLVTTSNVKPGDLVAFRKSGGWQHMGIVSSTRTGIAVISGNTGAPDNRADGVFEKPLSNWTKIGYTVAFLRNDR